VFVLALVLDFERGRLSRDCVFECGFDFSVEFFLECEGGDVFSDDIVHVFEAVLGKPRLVHEDDFAKFVDEFDAVRGCLCKDAVAFFCFVPLAFCGFFCFEGFAEFEFFFANADFFDGEFKRGEDAIKRACEFSDFIRAVLSVDVDVKASFADAFDVVGELSQMVCG